MEQFLLEVRKLLQKTFVFAPFLLKTPKPATNLTPQLQAVCVCALHCHLQPSYAPTTLHLNTSCIFRCKCIIRDVHFGSKFWIVTILAEWMARGSMVPTNIISQFHADSFAIFLRQSPFWKFMELPRKLFFDHHQTFVVISGNTSSMWLAHGHLHALQLCPCASCIVAASRPNLRWWMLVPSPPDLQQLALVMFFIPATSANTLPTLVVVTLCNLRWWSFS